MNFWIVFALCGAMAIPCIVAAIGFGEGAKEKIKGTLICVVGWFIIAGVMWGSGSANDEKWNDGYCQCGTHWELRGASQYRSSHTKYYVCPNCHAEIELNY